MPPAHAPAYCHPPPPPSPSMLQPCPLHAALPHAPIMHHATWQAGGPPPGGAASGVWRLFQVRVPALKDPGKDDITAHRALRDAVGWRCVCAMSPCACVCACVRACVCAHACARACVRVHVRVCVSMWA